MPKYNYDPMPQPGDGPEYWADLAYWYERHPESGNLVSGDKGEETCE